MSARDWIEAVLGALALFVGLWVLLLLF